VASLNLERVAIIGLGAIGGSIAKALVRSGVRVRAYTASAADADDALRAGIAVANELGGCVAGMQVVVIAVPLAAHAAVADAAIAAATDDAVLLHAASLQSANAVGPARRVIGTHPLAGTHRAGFAAADADLFGGCVVSIEARAADDARTTAERLWRLVGARGFEYRTAEEHDRLMAWVSHLPQLAATALADAIAAAGVGSSALGPGGRDATRLAASPFEMWGGILAATRPDAARAAAALERSVSAIRSALESGDMQAVERIWASARAWAEPR
jgi:prephenate dehydrogenase